jgi:hypothetical protein
MPHGRKRRWTGKNSLDLIQFNPALTLRGQIEAMMQTHAPHSAIPVAVIPAYSPDQWLYQLFSPLAVAEGSTLRRDVADVEAHIGRQRFLEEVKLRGYTASEEKGQFVLTLNRRPIRVMI